MLALYISYFAGRCQIGIQSEHSIYMYLELSLAKLLFQDSGGRDLKSAQNTPSRQPLAPPNQMAPPPLHQDNRQSMLAGGDFKKVIQLIS